MKRIRLILILAIQVALISLLAGATFIQGGSPAATSTAGPPGPPPKGPPDEGRSRERERDSMRVAPMFRDITDEDVAQIMAFVGENMPWLKPELEKLKETDQARFRQVCRHMRFDIAQLKNLKESDPEAFKNAIEERLLRARAGELAVKIRAATDAVERDALKADLRKVIDQLFDKETLVRNAQIREVEKRLDVLRKDLQDRAAKRDEIVEKRVDDMVKGRPEGPPERSGPPQGPPPPPESKK
jgi:hypothetical protein